MRIDAGPNQFTHPAITVSRFTNGSECSKLQLVVINREERMAVGGQSGGLCCYFIATLAVSSVHLEPTPAR